jgi:AbrB family looped-hinge helix DNA binding protein
MPRVKLRKFNQVTIPKKIGEKVGVEEGDYLEVEVHEKGILFKPLKAIFIDKKELTEEKVLEFVGQGEISSSRGAELLGMSFHDFIDLMHKKGIPLLRYTKEIREEAAKNAEKLFSKEKA